MPQKDSVVLGDSHLPQGPQVVAGSGSLSPFWPSYHKFNHLSRPSHLHALEQTLQIKLNSNCTRRTSSAGATPTCPRDPSSGGSGLCEPIFGPKSPNSIIGSSVHLHALERCRSNQLNHATRRTLQCWGDSHLLGTHPVVAVVSKSHFGPNPQFNHSSHPEADSMRWSRRCRSNQLNHATKDFQCWGTYTCPKGPSSGGSGLCEPILAPNPPKFNHLSRPKLHA
jgi:hypothetical protein